MALSLLSTVDLLDWNSLIDNRTKLSKLLLVPNMEVRGGDQPPGLDHCALG